MIWAIQVDSTCGPKLPDNSSARLAVCAVETTPPTLLHRHSRHHPAMGQDSPPTQVRDGQETFSSADRVASADERRHVLPKDLPNAVKHLNDEELDRLLVVTLAEAKRRGRHTTPTNKRPPTRPLESAPSLTRGQLNAVHAAFQGWHYTRTHRPPVRLIPIGRADGAEI